MKGYRLYLVSELTQRFEPAIEFEAKDDRAAIAHAEAQREERNAELWSGDKMVKDLKA